MSWHNLVLVIAILLILSLTNTATWAITRIHTRRTSYKQGRWDGLEKGYADAMEDGWVESVEVNR